jgi:hypothetical protein
MSEAFAVEDSDVKKRLEIEQRAKSGAGWFYWIAGLSVINSIILMAGGSISFPVGLGITQFIIAIAISVGKGAQFIGLILNLIVAAVFIGIGAVAHKRHSWAFIVGLILYGVDGLLFLLIKEWLSIGFHIFAFIGILSGLKAANKLKESSPAVSTTVPFVAPASNS